MPDNPSPEPLHPAVIIFNKVFRFLNWAAVVLIAFALIGGAVIWSVEAYENRLRVHTELGGVRLGMTKDDVLFEKGKPVPAKPWERARRKLGKLDQTKPWEIARKRWTYYSRDGWHDIYFDEKGTVKAIVGDQDYESVSGIRIGADSDRVTTDRATTNVGPTLKRDGTTRAYFYPSYNVQFILEKRRVTHIIVRDLNWSD